MTKSRDPATRCGAPCRWDPRPLLGLPRDVGGDAAGLPRAEEPDDELDGRHQQAEEERPQERLEDSRGVDDDHRPTLASELERGTTDPDEVAASLWAAVRAWQGKEEPEDDQTVMVVIRAG